MKLIDFRLDKELNELRRSMGAKLHAFTAPPTDSNRLTVEEIERLAREGIEIPLGEVHVLEDGTLAYKNQRVVLYIRDVKQYRNARPSEEELPRFHVADCDKLKEMRANNRYERYVVATRDTGVFTINFKPHGSQRFLSSDRHLKVCQFCLGRLDWDSFSRFRFNSDRSKTRSERRRIVSAFSLERYFAKYGRTFIERMPSHTEGTAPINDYNSDFAKIAEAVKRKRAYRCDICGIVLINHKKFLHAHHKNGIQSDDRENNIAILCIRDHAEQPNHRHMKRLPEYEEFCRLLDTGILR